MPTWTVFALQAYVKVKYSPPPARILHFICILNYLKKIYEQQREFILGRARALRLQPEFIPEPEFWLLTRADSVV